VLLGGFALELAAQEYTYTSAATNMHRRNADLNMTKRWVDEYFDVQFDWVTTENQFEKLNVLLAAGEIPDMIAMRMNPVQLATYADQGVLAELSVDTIREVMPEFHGRHAEQEAWKAAVLAGEIELEDIDTEPFNFAARGKPTLASSKETRNMVSGVTGRPAAQSIG